MRNLAIIALFISIAFLSSCSNNENKSEVEKSLTKWVKADIAILDIGVKVYKEANDDSFFGTIIEMSSRSEQDRSIYRTQSTYEKFMQGKISTIFFDTTGTSTAPRENDRISFPYSTVVKDWYVKSDDPKLYTASDD